MLVCRSEDKESNEISYLKPRSRNLGKIPRTVMCLKIPINNNCFRTSSSNTSRLTRQSSPSYRAYKFPLAVWPRIPFSRAFYSLESQNAAIQRRRPWLVSFLLVSDRAGGLGRGKEGEACLSGMSAIPRVRARSHYTFT